MARGPWTPPDEQGTLPRVHLRLAWIAAAVVALTFAASASAEPYLAPGNKVLWGGNGGYTAGSIRAFAEIGRASCRERV